MARLPQQQQVRQPRNQLEADELYARQLAEQYNNAGRSRGRGGVQNTQTQQPRHRRNDSDEDYTGDDKEHSFLDGGSIPSLSCYLRSNANRRSPCDQGEHPARLPPDPDQGQPMGGGVQEEAGW